MIMVVFLFHINLLFIQAGGDHLHSNNFLKKGIKIILLAFTGDYHRLF